MKTNNIKEKLKFFLYFNILTILLLIWKLYPSKHVNVSGIYLERKYNPDGKLNINFNRLLAKAKVKKKDAPIYEKIKKEESCDLDYYMKSYKYRCSKKKGLRKLDCYYENKIFKGIDKINKLANTPNITKSKFKRKIRKKYGLRIGLIYFFYVLALAIGIIDLINRKCSLGFCSEIFDDGGQYLIPALGDLFVYVIPSVLTLIIIYVLIKIVKYERINSCKRRMKSKEYYRLCKDIF